MLLNSHPKTALNPTLLGVYHLKCTPPFARAKLACRSEGIPSRDISSLGAMDWGLARLENSSAAAVVAAVAAAVVALWMEGDDL